MFLNNPFPGHGNRHYRTQSGSRDPIPKTHAHLYRSPTGAAWKCARAYNPRIVLEGILLCLIKYHRSRVVTCQFTRVSDSALCVAMPNITAFSPAISVSTSSCLYARLVLIPLDS